MIEFIYDILFQIFASFFPNKIEKDPNSFRKRNKVIPRKESPTISNEDFILKYQNKKVLVLKTLDPTLKNYKYAKVEKVSKDGIAAIKFYDSYDQLLNKNGKNLFEFRIQQLKII